MNSSPGVSANYLSNDTRENSSCQNCHYFHRLYIHKYLLSRCRAFHQMVHEPRKICSLWLKRYYPPYHYLTIK